MTQNPWLISFKEFYKRLKRLRFYEKLIQVQVLKNDQCIALNNYTIFEEYKYLNMTITRI